MRRIAVFLMMALGLVSAQYAQIIDSSSAVSDVYSSSAYKVYVDTFGTNSDLGLRLCGAGARYVASVYSADLGGGTLTYTANSWNLTAGSDRSVVYTSTAHNASCYETPIDAYGFSQFRDFTRTPRVFVSAFPGRPHALYSSSTDGSSPSLAPIDDATGGWLRGSYSVTRSFSQAAGDVSATVNSITFETDVGSVTRNPSDADWGLSSTSGRSMLLALCSDDYGDMCSDAYIANDSADFPVALSMGAVPINDQNAYDRYVVVNGLGYGICVGADLTSSIARSPGSIYYGGSSNITLTVTNSGNVNVTTAFPLRLDISGPGGYTQTYTWTITEDLSPGASANRTYQWNATGYAPSGTYTFTSAPDITGVIAECDEGNNNASTTVAVSPFYTLHILIDGNETNEFPLWGRPYNVTMWITDSNNDTLINPEYVITETNGLNPFTPTQVWNDGSADYGLISQSVGTMEGNGSGYIEIVMVPTCNLLYTTYSAENVDAHVGDYSMKVNAYTSGGSPLILAYNGSLVYDHPLLVGNFTCADPGWVNDKEIVNKNRYVTWVYDWIYEVYSITKKLVMP